MPKTKKEQLVEKFKEMPVEDRTLFREALSEADPDTFLSGEEVSKVREMLAGTKKGGKKSLIDSFFE